MVFTKQTDSHLEGTLTPEVGYVNRRDRIPYHTI